MQTHRLAHSHTHTHAPVAYQGNETEEKVFKKRKVFKEVLKELTGGMVDRNRELVPDNWSLVRERALTTGLCSEGWYSEHSGVCRRAELPGGSVKVKSVKVVIVVCTELPSLDLVLKSSSRCIFL